VLAQKAVSACYQYLLHHVACISEMTIKIVSFEYSNSILNTFTELSADIEPLAISFSAAVFNDRFHPLTMTIIILNIGFLFHKNDYFWRFV
jgi:hypothetical protein